MGRPDPGGRVRQRRGPRVPGLRRRARRGRRGDGGGHPLSHAAALVDRLFRRESGRAVATLARTLRDLDLAEEAVQDAFLVALERWPRDGVPANPAAWITLTARHRALDRLRRARRLALLAEVEAAAPAPTAMDDGVPDGRLALIFTCCRTDLAPEARVALTLRHVGGLTVGEIARAFLTSEAAMAQRLVRARRALAGATFEAPARDELDEHLPSVLSTLYLIFNEGYAALRPGLTAEAIRMARLLAALAPGEPEARGLLALLLLQDSRRAARTDEAGRLVLLTDQDRGRWDRAQIDEAVRLLPPPAGPYALQAAIAAEHGRAAHAADTDWQRIAGLYEQLGRLNPSPVVRLNGAVAIAEAHGAEAGLRAVEAAGRLGALDGYHLFHSARAELLRRLGRGAEAGDAYERALALVAGGPERDFLEDRLRAVRPG